MEKFDITHRFLTITFEVTGKKKKKNFTPHYKLNKN